MTERNVLVTGASKGIGYATAVLFAQEGCRVYANYHKTYEPLRLLAESCARAGQTLIPARADVTAKKEVDALFALADKTDVLVNNAGIAQTKEFTQLSEADWDNMLAANLKSVFLCSQAALPYMLRAKRGCIINIASVWGVAGGSCEAHYSAAKAGIVGLTKALAKELGPSGIRVNCIAPGVIDTDMNGALAKAERQALTEATPLGRIGRPQDIARAALFLAANDFITGEVLNVNGGFYI
ncbi:MAG: 3-oxoacyl-ACP reductase FabG [Acidaminococcales bacterium]|jgi:3-oxoacyl-[acyl-carrier protein] reductase|nr:3-oxoacyl-ACP reductase FabG [Acidaminococcales bacterium]